MNANTAAYFKRLDPERNVARFYALSLQPTLFGDMSLVREWGRLGTRGRYKAEMFSTELAARTQMERLVRTKLRRGYCQTGQGE